jgi:hypothetical protein
MAFDTGGEHGDDRTSSVEQVAQEAIDAVADTYSSDAHIDVEQELRDELASRGVRFSDASWVAEVARHIRSGHRLTLGEADGPLTGP